MSGTDRTNEPPKHGEDKPKHPDPAPDAHDAYERDEYEDGDIATPKQDSHGDDDEPL
jgi:hypothetical protein